MSQRFDFQKTSLEGLFKIDRKPITDSRGAFSRFFCIEEFKEVGFNHSIQQINHSITKQKGTVRGLHFQYPPFSETKIVSCVKGSVFDVAVDLRQNSPTFLQWHAEILSNENQSTLFIPDGFAHGFQTLEDNCELLYLVSNIYAPDSEGGVHALDSKIAINWPLEVVKMSKRDSTQPNINKGFKGIEL